MKILYFDCFAGIAGDMTLGALLELGFPLPLLQERLDALRLPGPALRLSAEKVMRKGISAVKFDVRADDPQPHRHYGDIAGMIDRSSLPAGTKDKTQRIFRRLAEAEAKVHGVEVERVHFHEVGAVDSIVDIVGTAAGLDYLGIEEVYASPLPFGSGFVETAHGRLPVPAPAVAELLKGALVHFESGPGERVTPTGAAIVAALARGGGAVPAMRITAVGCGAGSKDFHDVPNVLRAVLGERIAEKGEEEIYVLETHIDDMNPEMLGFLMERLFREGALDVAFSPLQMKKNRPGSKLTVLAAGERLQRLGRLVLNESTSTGIRYYPVRRLTLERDSELRETSLGWMRVKVIRENGKLLRVAPEFEECRRIALEREMPLPEVYRIVEKETCGQ